MRLCTYMYGLRPAAYLRRVYSMMIAYSAINQYNIIQIFWQRIVIRCNNIKYYIRTAVLANLHINPLGIGNRFVYYNSGVFILYFMRLRHKCCNQLQRSRYLQYSQYNSR